MRIPDLFIVAEISGEHLGSEERAHAMIDAACDAGADAVKFQCFDPARLADRRGGRDKVLEEGLWKGRDLLGLYRQTHTPREWFSGLFAHAWKIGIVPFSSVFDRDDIDFLETVGCPFYKVSAYESRDGGLIRYAVASGKPVILSLKPDDEIGAAQRLSTAALHCVSKYPCPDDEIDLQRIDALRETFKIVGFSDHTTGIDAAIRAVRDHGARIVEKHFTLSRAHGGPDVAFSLEPAEFRQMADGIHAVTVRCEARPDA